MNLSFASGDSEDGWLNKHVYMLRVWQVLLIVLVLVILFMIRKRDDY